MADEQDIRVLIVDDDPALLDALSEMLRLRWKAVRSDTCDNATAALNRTSAIDYDAIISDIKMPGKDGIELLAEVHRIRPELPVLLITGHGETDLAIRALRAGAYDLIQKPLDRDYLIAALVRAVEAKRLRRDVEEKRVALEKHAQDLEERVHERTAELLRANRAKDEFLGLVSHELRTPITVILGNAEVLHRRIDSMRADDRTTAIADLRFEAQRLQRIVDNLLVLARLEHARGVQSEPVHIERLVDAQARLHGQAFAHRQLVVDIEPVLPIVLADPVHIELILRNLLSNAEKYSPPDTPIEVRVRTVDGEVQVSVLDEGDGIAEDEAEAVFTPFYRSLETSRATQGIGIGLAVCKRLVEAHGGSIRAQRRPDGGSEFRFHLQAAVEAATADTGAQDLRIAVQRAR